MTKSRNELLDFIIAETRGLESEYERVQRRVKEDPGTAGDQGEENWASILKKWLPQEYFIVTKGRILGHNGAASPQVDLIVLHPSYPPNLRDKKLYLAGGVAAVFECKLTLESDHIANTIENCADIKRLTARRTGTPYLELNSSMLYGLLAHSHSWQREKSTPIENVTRTIDEKDREVTNHPREMLDIVCVADLATWVLQKKPYYPRGFPRYSEKCTTVYFPYIQPSREFHPLSPMGQLLLTLIKKLAWEDTRLRRLAEYFSLTLNDYLGGASGMPRVWEPSAVYTDKVREWLEQGQGVLPIPENVYGSPGGLWSEWRLTDSLSSVSE